MGMFDVVVFDMELPGFPFRGCRFQTKNLECCMDIYTVTKTGRLCMTGSDFLEDDATEREAVDMDFHGDLRLIAEDSYEQYAVRFTHGTLEWIRPIADIEAAELARRKSGLRGGVTRQANRCTPQPRSIASVLLSQRVHQRLWTPEIAVIQSVDCPLEINQAPFRGEIENTECSGYLETSVASHIHCAPIVH
jgi:hypothetical protein